jgi:hypothetical protein
VKIALLLAAALAASWAPASAQQKTTGDIIAEGWERGRRIREEMDARRQQQAQAAPLPAQTAKAPPRPPVALSPTDGPASSDMAVILNSNNGLPRIVILAFKTGNCGETARFAVTTDKDGQNVNGCVVVNRDTGTMTADWEKYGRRVYDLSEWSLESPGDANKKPLGER